MITILIYIDRTALFIMGICYTYYLFIVCVVQYMCLSCSSDLVSICATKEIYIKLYIIEHHMIDEVFDEGGTLGSLLHLKP